MPKRRLIQPNDLPETLWLSSQNCIRLAPNLVKAWKNLLEHAGLYEKALERVPEKIIGGVDKEATDAHLAWRFSGSSARMQLAMLDPFCNLSGVSDAFARVFSGGTVLVADLPCGSGAAILTILCTIAELRRQGCVPREPLHVKVVGGELSKFARGYANNATQHILASLKEQAIWVEAEFVPWDVLDKFSTADLIKKLTLQSTGCSARMLVLANFSGFLQGNGKWKDASPQFEDLFLHSRDLQSVVIWIEPKTNEVTDSGGLFGRVFDWFKRNFSSLHKPETLDELQLANLCCSAADAQHPLRSEHQFHVNLVIQRFDLPIAGVKP